ncbi:glycerol-3-phosphate dehydrogenase subunit GlpB [Enterovibrio norvegicus]|uniref:glycerol-3-phosphate dehydrogenase subunit GlpB n=1 Tax=Enterovibrio norvegicus TaxID=188144 RepID=UPI000CB20F7A|nr:glycerol-3-phosphate dehydrogenase subunit GlpB [Enterovibrio norvegicus]PMN70301.1 anaerobic glycerol-3-phosphate dehydrogenase subunit B [Enterovibrio norvegicus]
MLTFDTIVIGGGLAGYCAAIKRAQAGFKTALISQGEGSLHFASGSIDVLAKDPDAFFPTRFPLKTISQLPPQHPHPYRKVGANDTRAALSWFRDVMEQQGIPFHQLDEGQNHWRITPFGTLKATWLSQIFCTMLDDEKPHAFERVIVASIEGFRDFQADVTAENLALLPQFANTPIKAVSIILPEQQTGNEMRAKRAIDYARAMREPRVYDAMCEQLSRYATPRDLVVLPSIFGNGDGQAYMARLQQDTQLQFHEVPTMPPSLLGIRISDALHRAFTQAGGTLLKGDSVTGATLTRHQEGHQVDCIYTQKMGDLHLRANQYVLASGSFFSRGLIATPNRIYEPVFGLDIAAPESRDDWYNPRFLDAQPYISSGVVTNDHLQPAIQGDTVINLHCIGGVLGGFDPVKEGSGGGVSIATGYAVATWQPVKEETAELEAMV